MTWAFIILTGAVFGLGAVLLVSAGNPGNYGFCAACQLRDIAGALGIHTIPTLQYARPEIIGLIAGSFLLSKMRNEFQTRSSTSSTLFIKFVLGFCMMLGALVFLGCPIRGVLRVAGGDLNGITAIAGFVAGVYTGVRFLESGFQLAPARDVTSPSGKRAGYLGVIAAGLLLAGVVLHLSFLNFSVKGPGSLHAPIAYSLAAGLIGGVMAQYSRLCMSGGVRNFILIRDTYLLKIYGVMFITALLGNLYFGFFKLSFVGQPLAHTMHIWNFMGLYVVGLAAVLGGGCPLRQLILVGAGHIDAMVSVLGMLAGAGMAHSINLAASADGVPVNGQIAVGLAAAVVIYIGYSCREKLCLKV